MEVTKWLKPWISVSRIGDSASVQRRLKTPVLRTARFPMQGDLSHPIDIAARMRGMWR
jgi:hypothetical protein